MSSFFDAPPIPREQWTPLVAQDEDREEVLEKIVTAWCTSYGKTDTDEHIAAGGLILAGRVFEDANTGDPIDLGDLLRGVEHRLGKAGEPEAFKARSDLHILMRDCHVREVSAQGVQIRPSFTTLRTHFDKTAFVGASFGDFACFESATFGDWARFYSATFGNWANFESATFGDWAIFASATFGHGASFASATFGDVARFDSATFGDGASFASAKFGDATSFDSATFGQSAHFNTASLGDNPSFVNCRFGPYGGIGGARTILPEAATRRRRIGRRLAAPWRWFSWRKVRALGELQLLTRVSYIALFVVPILAGTWPAVRAGVNWVNDEVRRAAAVFHESAQRLEQAAGGAKLVASSQPAGAPAAWQWSEVQSRVEEGMAIVRRIDAQLGEKTIGTPELPPTWVWGFFAALAVTLGHLAYQVWADERVRRQTIEDFARERSGEFRECTENQRRDLLARALPWIRQIAGRLPAARHPNLVKRHGQTVWVPSSLDDLLRVRTREDRQAPAAVEETAPPKPDSAHDEPAADASEATANATEASAETNRRAIKSPSDVPRPALWREELELVIIDEGARAEYELAAREGMGPAAVSGLLYAAGVVLILWIIYLQSESILRQGGVIAG